MHSAFKFGLKLDIGLQRKTKTEFKWKDKSNADTVSGGEGSAFHEFVNQSSVDYDEYDSGEICNLGMCDNFKHYLALFYPKLGQPCSNDLPNITRIWQTIIKC